MWLILLPFRYVLGMPLSGERQTNATFFADGDGWAVADARRRSFFGTREPYKWDLMAGWKRGLWRLGIPAALVGIWWCWTNHQTLTATALVIGSGMGLGIYAAATYRRVREAEHMRRYVLPLHQALAPQLGYGPEMKPRHWIHVPMNFRDEDAEIRLELPVSFYAGPEEAGTLRAGRSMRGAIDGYVYEKLGLSSADMIASYAMQGEFPAVTYKHRARVPKLVTADDIREHMEAADESAPVIGLTRGKKPVSIDLDSESPHVAVSIGTGGGKSMLTRSAIIHVLMHGGLVVVLDVKRTSHRWLKGHPRVLYVRDPADISAALLRLRAELDRRQILTDDEEDAWPGPRILVVVEERNTMVGAIKSWWAKTRTKEDPTTPPALDALNELAFMGREPMMHLWSIAQSATARTMGGPEGRENYACRILGRFTYGNWNMLVGKAHAMPKSSRHRGRVQVVMEEVVETQTTMWEKEEAQEAAWSIFPEGLDTPEIAPSVDDFFGRLVVGDLPGSPVVSGEVLEAHDDLLALPSPVPAMPSDLGEQRGTVPEESPVSRENVEAPKRENVIQFERPVTLTEALEKGILTGFSPDLKKAKDALKKAKRRAGSEFPQAVGKRGNADVYKPSQLAHWERNRPRATSEETA
ncbi:MAG: hypothetical protein ACRDPS_21935 [Nocardioides sp.]|uniref:hypothetical protein n=1 Tax=Nocardioides sp. TaxID=35761 RepID=UPI003D6B4DE3